MGRITVSLIRRRAEHNEGEIQSLEELSLHQEKLEKIELLDKICRNLRILLLQNNSITKIENVSRLKQLEYLNLGINLLEKIENLEGCESLKKLDLTLNFIGEINSVAALKSNYFLEQLYLVGNPCHDFPSYRDYIITMLPQLKQLDGVDITKSERLLAKQNFDEVEATVLLHQEAYLKEKQKGKRSSSKKAIKSKSDGENNDNTEKEKEEESPVKVKKSRPKTSKSSKSQSPALHKHKEHKDKEPKEDKDNTQTEPEEENNKGFWAQVTDNTPEVRLEMNQRLEKQEDEKAAIKKSPLSIPKLPRRLESKDGRPLNVNEPKLSFTLSDEIDRNQIVLDLAVPRFLCTTLIEADVQPTYVRIMVKGKAFQLVLPNEVKPDSSFAQRSQTTGHLIVTMPKVYENSSLIWRGGSGGALIELKKPSGLRPSKTAVDESLGGKDPSKKSDKVDKPPGTKSNKSGDTTPEKTSPNTASPKTPKATLPKTPSTKTDSPKTDLPKTPSPKISLPKTPKEKNVAPPPEVSNPTVSPAKSKTPSNNSSNSNSNANSKKKTAIPVGNVSFSAKVPSTPAPVVKARGGSSESQNSANSLSNSKMTSSQLFTWNLKDNVPPLI